MSVIPVRSDFLLNLLTEVGKSRCLQDHETDLIEEIVRAESDETEFQWTEEHDRMLEQAARCRGIHRLAHDLGVSPGAAYARFSRAKKRKTVKLRDARRKG